jgi:hypothetical protein
MDDLGESPRAHKRCGADEIWMGLKKGFFIDAAVLWCPALGAHQ